MNPWLLKIQKKILWIYIFCQKWDSEISPFFPTQSFWFTSQWILELRSRILLKYLISTFWKIFMEHISTRDGSKIPGVISCLENFWFTTKLTLIIVLWTRLNIHEFQYCNKRHFRRFDLKSLLHCQNFFFRKFKFKGSET